MSSRHCLHDVPLYLVVFEDGNAVIDEDWRLSGLKVRAKVGWGALHVDRGDLEADRLELGQEVEVHEVLLNIVIG